MTRAHLVGVMVGLAAGLVVSCDPGDACSAQTCVGCCDAQGLCRRGDDPRACGPRGSTCSVCSATDVCRGPAGCEARPQTAGGAAAGGTSGGLAGGTSGGLAGGASAGGTSAGGSSGGAAGGSSAGGSSAGGSAGGTAVPTTCSTNSRWTLGTIGNADMNPGLACQSCHRGANFQEQNPDGGHQSPFYVYGYMGTVYGDFHEQDLCNGNPVDTTVEILELDGGLIAVMQARYPSGNFFSVALPGAADRPYRARVRSAGRVRQMGSVQTNGDCNACHTEQGRNGAPGRIVRP